MDHRDRVMLRAFTMARLGSEDAIRDYYADMGWTPGPDIWADAFIRLQLVTRQLADIITGEQDR